MTSLPSSVSRSRRSGGALSLRPAVQRNCRQCHDPLGSALDECMRCHRLAAGVRPARLALRLMSAAVLVAAGFFFLGQ